jgi:hypothetical protein
MMIIPYDYRYLEKKQMVKKTKKQFSMKKLILGSKRACIAMIGFGLTWLAGQESWAWVGGIAAERVWMTVEFYLNR